MAASPTAHKRSATRKGPVPRQRGGPAAEAGQPGRSVPVPHVHAPSIRMPSGLRGNVLWWGGLAGLAVFGVIDWPVAAVVAAGTWVAEQRSRQVRQSAGH
ncbi:MAG: hypothetical protein ACYCPF_15375 [Streptosporangiaceae bacterium]